MDSLISILSQLAARVPILLAYVLGIILALVFWRRNPGPSLLTLIAMVLLLGSSLVHPFLFQYILRMQIEWDWTHEKLGWVLAIIGFVWSLVSAVALVLLLAAVFSGRSGRNLGQPSARVPSLPPSEPPVRAADEFGITTRPGG